MGLPKVFFWRGNRQSMSLGGRKVGRDRMKGEKTVVGMYYMGRKSHVHPDN